MIMNQHMIHDTMGLFMTLTHMLLSIYPSSTVTLLSKWIKDTWILLETISIEPTWSIQYYDLYTYHNVKWHVQATLIACLKTHHACAVQPRRWPATRKLHDIQTTQNQGLWLNRSNHDIVSHWRCCRDWWNWWVDMAWFPPSGCHAHPWCSFACSHPNIVGFVKQIVWYGSSIKATQWCQDVYNIYIYIN